MLNQLRRGHRAWPMFELKSGAAMAAPAAPMPPPLMLKYKVRVQQPMLPQLSLFQQCSIQSQDVMQTWLHWRCQDALLVQKHFVALFHPKPNECLRFDVESFNLMCTYTVVTHPCHISPLAQARPMMLCIYTSMNIHIGPSYYWGEPERAPH